MIIKIIKIFLVTATIYHAEPAQTDSTPFITASGAHINPTDPQGHRWIAVSKDLEEKGLKFGVKVKVTGADHLDGVWTVQDRMNSRWVKRIDFLVNTSRKGGKWEDVKIELITE